MIYVLYSFQCRVVGLPADGSDSGVLDDSFKLAWKALMNGEAIRCSFTLENMEAVPKPSVVILDVSLSALPHAYSWTKLFLPRGFNCHGSKLFDLNDCIHPFSSG
jgi:hypothetical protein